MDHEDQIRLAYLRAQLASARLEKQNLACEIQSPMTPPSKRHRATRRYSAVSAELQNVAAELEKFIAAARNAVIPNRFP
jgi:hypothetical protein